MGSDPYTLFEWSEGREFDKCLARRLIDSQFPQWAHLPITAVDLDGWDNRSFRLGSELTVRLPSGNWYAQQVDKEQHWLPVLAPQLPLPIPSPVAKGEPDAEFPYPWSVYRWLDGEPTSRARIRDLSDFATKLARFLKALGRVDATNGPTPGQHNFFRGGPLSIYEEETIAAIDALADEIPVEDVKRRRSTSSRAAPSQPIVFRKEWRPPPAAVARTWLLIDQGTSLRRQSQGGALGAGKPNHMDPRSITVAIGHDKTISDCPAARARIAA